MSSCEFEPDEFDPSSVDSEFFTALFSVELLLFATLDGFIEFSGEEEILFVEDATSVILEMGSCEFPG